MSAQPLEYYASDCDPAVGPDQVYDAFRSAARHCWDGPIAELVGTDGFLHVLFNGPNGQTVEETIVIAGFGAMTGPCLGTIVLVDHVAQSGIVTWMAHCRANRMLGDKERPRSGSDAEAALDALDEMWPPNL